MPTLGRSHVSCRSYRPGHQVHYIQARVSREAMTSLEPNATLLELADDGVITLLVDGELRRFWNHDPTRVRAIVDHHGEDVTLRPKSVLAVGTFLVSVSDADTDDRRCTTDDLAGPGELAPPRRIELLDPDDDPSADR